MASKRCARTLPSTQTAAEQAAALSLSGPDAARPSPLYLRPPDVTLPGGPHTT
jgi:hypothetical protein